eukprot:scaffold11635_cov107-Isochrysis_galbana.AAC.3
MAAGGDIARASRPMDATHSSPKKSSRTRERSGTSLTPCQQETEPAHERRAGSARSCAVRSGRAQYGRLHRTRQEQRRLAGFSNLAAAGRAHPHALRAPQPALTAKAVPRLPTALGRLKRGDQLALPLPAPLLFLKLRSQPLHLGQPSAGLAALGTLPRRHRTAPFSHQLVQLRSQTHILGLELLAVFLPPRVVRRVFGVQSQVVRAQLRGLLLRDCCEVASGVPLLLHPQNLGTERRQLARVLLGRLGRVLRLGLGRRHTVDQQLVGRVPRGEELELGTICAGY